jgi:flagellar hook-associated protein 2
MTNEADSSLSSKLQLNNIQVAKGATFKYNGVEIARDTNDISDLIVGVTIKLNQNQESTQSASISIAQNNTSISSEISLFVTNYNSLRTNLDDMTNSNRETGAVGIFNGESFIKSISRDITDMILKVDSNGNSLMDYGISIDRYGEMSLDTTVFAEKFVTDPEGMELFFSGNSEKDGLFTQLDTKMKEYTGYDKLLSNFSEQLTSKKESITEQYDRQKESLDTRYNILTKKFIAYDAMISKLNSQFSSMKMMIDAEYAAKD